MLRAVQKGSPCLVSGALSGAQSPLPSVGSEVLFAELPAMPVQPSRVVASATSVVLRQPLARRAGAEVTCPRFTAGELALLAPLAPSVLATEGSSLLAHIPDSVVVLPFRTRKAGQETHAAFCNDRLQKASRNAHTRNIWEPQGSNRK